MIDTYHLRLRGGFSLLNWMGTESKLEPMYDELLKNYPVIETIK